MPFSSGGPFQSSVFDQATRIEFVRTYLASGLSQKDFCVQQGLKSSVFRNWNYRYRKTALKKDQTKDLCEPIRSDKPLFLAVKVMPDDEEPMEEAPALLSPSLHIDIHAFRLFIPTGADVQTLQNVLSILKNLP